MLGGDELVASVEKAAKRTATRTSATKRKMHLALNKKAGQSQRPEVLCDPFVVAAGWLSKLNSNTRHGMHKYSRRYFILRRTDLSPRNAMPTELEQYGKQKKNRCRLLLSCYESDIHSKVCMRYLAIFFDPRLLQLNFNLFLHQNKSGQVECRRLERGSLG
jgi:hypothetical protein